MSSYYAPRSSNATFRTSSRVAENRSNENDETSPSILPLDDSIYIFPNPSTTPPYSPPSPASSHFSAPTDLDLSDLSSFGSRSPSSGPSRTAEKNAAAPMQQSSQYSSPVGDNEVEIDVELWELEFSTDQDAASPDESWTWSLEDEVERISAGDVNFSYLGGNGSVRRARLTSPPPLGRWNEWEQSARPYRRARSQSRARTLSSLSSVSVVRVRPPTPKPHPRLHIPLLSFFASMLSIDLDDPALRLLTNADSGDCEAILFPGHTTEQLLSRCGDEVGGRDEQEDSDEDGDGDEGRGRKEAGECEQPHGLPRLLLASISDQSTVALRSLRKGLAVYVPASPGALPIPGPTEILGICRAVGQVCVKGGQVWREVWWSGPSSESRP